MKQLYLTANPAEIALLKSVFESAGVEVVLFDEHTSSLSALAAGYMPCRFMVADEEYSDACDVLKDCKLEPCHE